MRHQPDFISSCHVSGKESVAAKKLNNNGTGRKQQNGRKKQMVAAASMGSRANRDVSDGINAMSRAIDQGQFGPLGLLRERMYRYDHKLHM